MAKKDNSKMTETTANQTEWVVREFELDISVSFDELYDSKMDLKNEQEFEKVHKNGLNANIKDLWCRPSMF